MSSASSLVRKEPGQSYVLGQNTCRWTSYLRKPRSSSRLRGRKFLVSARVWGMRIGTDLGFPGFKRSKHTVEGGDSREGCKPGTEGHSLTVNAKKNETPSNNNYWTARSSRHSVARQYVQLKVLGVPETRVGSVVWKEKLTAASLLPPLSAVLRA